MELFTKQLPVQGSHGAWKTITGTGFPRGMENNYRYRVPTGHGTLEGQEMVLPLENTEYGNGFRTNSSLSLTWWIDSFCLLKN